jgi:LysM repeat protein
MTYEVKKGDTLTKIAKAHGLTLAKLLDANPRFKTNPDKINIGDKLKIPGRKARPVIKPKPEAANKALGALSAKYETGGRGPGTVSSGRGDAGGVSYGSYQMSGRLGVAAKFVSQPDFPFKNEFKNLVPGTEQFNDKWREIAAAHPKTFHNSQHNFIKRTHFDPLAAKIKNEDGINISTRSKALQDVVWSTAVQHGPGTSIIHKAIAALNLSPANPEFDKKLIKAIYAERGRKDANGVLVYFKSNSPEVQQGVANRFKNEEIDALNMLNT